MWEWCQDWFDKNQEKRAIRGESAWKRPSILSCHFYSELSPDAVQHNIEFHCAKSVE